MIVVFVDTNLFLQCKDIKQLSWHEIFKDDEIIIKVPSAVLDEIDRHKQDGNNRRAKRARKASSYFRSVILNDETKINIRETATSVELSLPYFSDSTSNNNRYNLDLSRPDNQIIAEIINYSDSNQNEKVVFLTHDTIPILTAKRCGIDVSVIPDEWLLDPEPDANDKKIKELEQKINKLEKTSPNIEVNSHSQGGDLTDSILINITTYDALPEQNITDLLSQVQERHPCVTNFDTPKASNMLRHPSHLMLGVTEHYQPPSDEKKREYTEEEYPQWLDSIKNYFEKLHTFKEFSTRQHEVLFKIMNSGTVPAENTIIEFQAVGGLFFMPIKSDDEPDEDKEVPKFPAPPAPPKGKWVQKNSILDMVNNLQGFNTFSNFGRGSDFPNFSTPFVPTKRDRNAFYWKDGKPSGPDTKWAYECKEFMHQVEPEIFCLNLMVSPKECITQGAIKCLVTASNLPIPVRKTLPVKIDYKKGDTDKFANKMLARYFPSFNFSNRAKE